MFSRLDIFDRSLFEGVYIRAAYIRDVNLDTFFFSGGGGGVCGGGGGWFIPSGALLTYREKHINGILQYAITKSLTDHIENH